MTAINKYIKTKGKSDNIYLIRESQKDWYLKFTVDGSTKYYYDCIPHTMRSLTVEDVCASDWDIKYV